MDEKKLLPLLVRKAASALTKENLTSTLLPVPKRSPIWDVGRSYSRNRFENVRQEKIVEYVMLAADRLGLQRGEVACRFTHLYQRAAQVRMENGLLFLEFDDTISWDMQRLTSSIGHEMAHVLLHQKNVHIGDEYQDELLTDTVAALAGFARIMMSARIRKIVIPRSDTYSLTKVGYLGRHSLKRLIKFHKWINSREPFRRLGGRSLKEKAVTCPACRQKLRLPGKTGRFVINCPSCFLQQDVRIVDGRSPGDWLFGFLDFARYL